MEELSQGKSLQETFPHLELTGALREYLEPARVGEIVFDRARGDLCVHLTSDRWIHKKHIFALEREIHSQLFPDVPIQVHVAEQFRLSGQYTPERFFEVYRPSMLQECRENDILLFYALRKAKLSFPETTVVEIALEDTMITRERGRHLIEYLTGVFSERCHMPVTVDLKWEKPAENKITEDERFLEAAKNIRTRRGNDDLSAGGETVSKDPGTTGGESVDLPWEEKGPPENDEKGGGEKTKKKKTKTRDDRYPDLIYGRYFEKESTPIAQLDETSGDVVLRGEILWTENRELRNEKNLFLFTMTDDTDTIRVKIFISRDEAGPLAQRVQVGKFILVRGIAEHDAYEHELTISRVKGMREGEDFRVPRLDLAPEKRVELHAHTKMSEMDAVSDIKALIRRAYDWGHPAIAITDHGVVQAFPDANKEMQAILKQDPETEFKVIYGCEAYLVDDLRGIAVHSQGQDLHGSFVVFDIETTGLSNLTCKIIEIGAVRVKNGEIRDRFSTFVNPGVPIPLHIEKLTGISDDMVEGAPGIEEVLPKFLDFVGDDVLVAHNAEFDVGFIRKACEEQGIERVFTRIDTVTLAQFLLPQLSRYGLEKVAKALQVPLENHHRAVDDAACTAEVFVRFVEMLDSRGIHTLEELNEQAAMEPKAVAKLRAHHAVFLVRNETGRVNLYRLISEAHLHYLNRKAKIPKSLVEKYREGLLIGSGCSEGELMQALLSGASEEEIARIVSFYDYLEVQPPENGLYLLENEKEESVRSMRDLEGFSRRIVKLGEQFEKPVAATGDVHFLDPEDILYRRIIKEGKKQKDLDEYDVAALYFRTTDEMLEAFSYLGEEKAREIVIDTPRKIAESIERISPIRAGKFPPVIENSDKTLRDICEKKAHELYGDELPGIVEERLNKELNSIISNGYAVMYIIAQKLVWKCNEDGYLVGSRGSVGSSFAATMAGITEVNPLPPHYLCGSCHYSDFDSEIVTKYTKLGKVGCDLPDQICPRCGSPLRKMGFHIPFETFLGFKGNKEPDIDLNFSGEYQSKAHRQTEIIFGKGQTYRAGTIGTMAEKTAFGYVKSYFENRNERRRSCELDRIAGSITGARRTTGQHPGGIIVLPLGEEIYSFTPVQYPADDPESGVISTHFDYHSIDENLLKLDLLGHDDPTMIQMLEELTGTDATKIPLDEPKVMSLFKNTEALGIRPEDIDGCPLGCLGVPEFGTGNAIQMLIDAKPEDFSDLIRLSGLSHGTNVWHGNARTLIQEGKCTISGAICTRDDIMAYLIAQGLESELAFTIMESVRKGKGLKPEWEETMRAHQVPDWYIWSCNKIEYMFPKAHAAAYVMMAYRIAWYKIYYPLAYYAAFFSIRASAFSYEKMCLGRPQLDAFIRDYEARSDSLSSQEKDTLKDMRIVQEMYARGFRFLPIDLYQSGAKRFRVVDGALLPSFVSIEGLGEKAAENIVRAAAEASFLSKDDFRRRTKTGKTILETMERLGILDGLAQSDQISLFDTDYSMNI